MHPHNCQGTFSDRYTKLTRKSQNLIPCNQNLLLLSIFWKEHSPPPSCEFGSGVLAILETRQRKSFRVGNIDFLHVLCWVGEIANTFSASASLITFHDGYDELFHVKGVICWRTKQRKPENHNIQFAIFIKTNKLFFSATHILLNQFAAPIS